MSVPLSSWVKAITFSSGASTVVPAGTVSLNFHIFVFGPVLSWASYLAFMPLLNSKYRPSADNPSLTIVSSVSCTVNGSSSPSFRVSPVGISGVMPLPVNVYCGGTASTITR
ncbi:hypothetical protein D3H35_20255 [Cohnella faecalis]|uniref:Uncharacterized protein n=1 Tax=Cohnella faecalis TaxID=2315694 RepID=A0A398CUI2_9BACL|nr:hypothetical protein D3H35_20255 [Cohnella faecalis]